MSSGNKRIPDLQLLADILPRNDFDVMLLDRLRQFTRRRIPLVDPDHTLAQFQATPYFPIDPTALGRIVRQVH